MAASAVLLLCTLAPVTTVHAAGGVGLSAAKPLSLSDPDSIFSTKRQQKMCESMPGMKRVLVEAVRLSVASCTQLMRQQRWNCSTGPSRIRILRKAFRETALLYALSSASITQQTARACAAGRLTACTCDLAQPAGTGPAADRWRWGGCGHNVRFAGRFTRRLLSKRSGRPQRRRAVMPRRRIHRHNWRVGIKTVMSGMTSRCKCHGVSGSCQLQTCWKQVSPLAHTGAAIQRKYQTAVRRASTQRAATLHPTSGDLSIRTNTIISRRRRRRGRRPLPVGPRNKLVFRDRSPSFCEPSGYGPGTATRRCRLGRHCAVLCCGRGHNTQLRSIASSCNCHVLWHQRTFKVECQLCTNVTEVYTCK